jgi:hypothetical protein
MALPQIIKARLMLVFALGMLATGWLPYLSGEPAVHAAESSRSILEAEGKGLMKNVEEMVAHGGMGDAKAIVHHCGEAAQYAERLITQLPASDTHANEARTSLNEVIKHCRRVSEIGVHADPGVLLNPALKARSAAQQSMHSIGLIGTNKG